MFHYDGALDITRVTIPDHRFPHHLKVTPIPLNLHTWKDEDYETRHRMNIDLVERFAKGNLPEGLKSLDDVEKYFPDLNFVHHWNYTTGVFLSVVMSFDRHGVVEEVWEGND